MDQESIQFAAQEIRGRTASLISNQKNNAAEGIRKLARAITAMGQKLDDQEQKKLSDITIRAATKVDDFGRSLREKEMGELIGDVRRLGKEHPVVFWSGAFALGFVVARLIFSLGEKKRALSSEDMGTMPEDEEFWEKGI
jgi:hypothetical protein